MLKGWFRVPPVKAGKPVKYPLIRSLFCSSNRRGANQHLQELDSAQQAPVSRQDRFR